GTIHRRRRCEHCLQRFSTIERVVLSELTVVKRDGRREPFKREKLEAGLRHACQKRPIPVGEIEAIVDAIEQDLYKMGQAEIATGVIGEMVMDRLRRLDDIAYIRFASVYRSYPDIRAMRQELDRLLSAANGDAGQEHFHLFWLGVLLFLIPAALRLFGRAASRAERLALMLALGALNFLPKFLTTPNHFLYHDELAHWRQAELIFSSGRLFIPNPSVYISQYFPGLQAMTVALRDLTGLTTFQVAAILILGTHIAVLVGMFVIGETLTGAARGGGVAALLYSLNPGFMYFDSQYAYESVAFVLVVWIIVSMVKMQAVPDRRAQWTWFATGLVLAAACIITHHVSSYVLVAVLWLMTATALI
ncbi:MAG: transcriptional regulator NrdR, partial [Chloroflexota bacterium]